MASSLFTKPLPCARALVTSGLHLPSPPAAHPPPLMARSQVGVDLHPYESFIKGIEQETLIKRRLFLGNNGLWRVRSINTKFLAIQMSSSRFLTRVPEGRDALYLRCFCTSSPGSGDINYTQNTSTNSQIGSQQPYRQQQSHQTRQHPPNTTQAPLSGTTNNDVKNTGATSTAGANSSSNAPKTSAAAEVIDKYLGPSTLKLDKPSSSTPPPPPKRNFGTQGTQEKKSGKDLVAESAACAVIEKYLGPWPGFPPRDPKIDEYLDSLPENAACAAIDKYFGPYKPLFVFKKNEENANNPPPPSRPPRSRMMNRARSRTWNNPQEQGGSVNRPWSSPQQGPNVGSPTPTQVSGTMPSLQVSASSPSQTSGSQTNTQGSDTVPSSQASGLSPSQTSGSHTNIQGSSGTVG